MEKITLMLADDHDVIRAGLKSLLETQDDFEIVAEAKNGSEALEMATELKPTVVVMDISMPEMDGLEATRLLQKQCPDCKVLALTVHEDKEYFFQMLEAGAKGYITKQAAAEELIAAIRAVADGYVYLQPALARWLLEDYCQLATSSHEKTVYGEGEGETGLEVLSPRERQVLEMIADGKTTPQIAEQLELSPKTVSRHRERIMNKLNLHSCAALVKFAIRTGLIRID